MVTLPLPFVATKFPGYFWNLDTQALSSLKVGGVLRELRLKKGNHFNHMPWGTKFYEVYHQGHRKILTVQSLEKLTAADSVIPVQENRAARRVA